MYSYTFLNFLCITNCCKLAYSQLFFYTYQRGICVATPPCVTLPIDPLHNEVWSNNQKQYGVSSMENYLFVVSTSLLDTLPE